VTAEVIHVKATTMPLIRAVKLVLPRRVDEWQVPVLVCTFVLLEIQNVEFDGDVLCNVTHREVVPLCEVKSVVVEIQVQVVLTVIFLLNLPQVSRFKA